MEQERVLISEMKKVFGSDGKRISHALKVTHYAKLLLQKEAGNPHVVIPAAILHDIGIVEAEKKYGSSAGSYQEQEGPPLARDIMVRAGIDKSVIDEVCTIIAHHHSPGKIDTVNFKILYDVDQLVNLYEEYRNQSQDSLLKTVDEIFFTETAKRLAKEIYLSNSPTKSNVLRDKG